MLARNWKKILLAICIIACIYNVMTKIISRHSLEENLKSANDGETVFDFSKKKETNTISSNSENVTNETSLVNEVSDENVLQEETIEENSSSTKYNSFFNFDFLFENT